MNILNKVLIGLICFLGIFAILWSAKVLNHYVKQSAEIKKMKDETESANKSADAAMDYDKGIPTLEVRNAALLADRAENWQFCMPKSVELLENKYARIVFSIKPDTVATMKAGDAIYVFDQRAPDNGGKYLGRFEVTQVQGQDVAADSLDVMTEPELHNLVSSRDQIAQAAPIQQTSEESANEAPTSEQAAWSIFSRCPTDRPDLFASLEDADKEKYLPETVRTLYAQYVQDPDKFNTLDFGTLFTYYYQKRVKMDALIKEKEMQKSEIDKSNTIASEVLTACQNQNAQIEKETEMMETQRKEVEKLRNERDAECKNIKAKIEKTQQENEQQIEKIRKAQRETLQKSGRTARETVGVTVR